jgi:hypothetical protein
MEEIEKAGEKDGLRVYNEYGSALTADAVALELRKVGLEVVGKFDMEREVRERADEVIHDKQLAEWEAKRSRTFRNFHRAFAGLFVLLGLQTILLMFGVLTGDWRGAQLAAVLLVPDIAAVIGMGYLWDRIPSKDSRPSSPRSRYY